MDFGSLLNAGKEILDQQHKGGMETAIQELLSDSNGKIDLESMISGIQDKGLNDMVASWLGDGENMTPSAENITSLLGNDTIASVAEKFGLDAGGLVGSLQSILPKVIDSSSKGGNLLSDIGGPDILAKIAGSFFHS